MESPTVNPQDSAERTRGAHDSSGVTAATVAGSGASPAGASGATSSDGFHKAGHAPAWRDFAQGEVGRGPCIPFERSNNPAAGQWDGRKLSRGIVADYKRMVVTDGEGIRNSVYVAGCPFRCEGCYNSSIWDFQAGHPYTDALEDAIIADLKPHYIQGLTLLGGEPFLNTPMLLCLVRRVREEYGHSKDIWSWTGYTWEELMRPEETPDKRELLDEIDVLVDGRYIAALKDSLLQFRGSSNQRVIDVQASLAQGTPVIWKKLHDQHRFIPDIYGKDRAAGEGSAS